ncbi:uncharacterized protein LOC133823820 [Humulus lupulus]|uniref:uncharacterized protein LOC133823820 n=1 Tax=Humulus lupulus TaxID=3486 RepID=UPI002B417922|nr:uncharacterized protein LOC133823820 [Humulus lupulus]
MSTLSWNCRGLGTPRTVQFLKECVFQKKPNFIFLCEILCKTEKVNRIKRSLGFEGMIVVESIGHSGGLALLWKFNEEAQLLSFSKNHIDVVCSPKNTPAYRLTGFYGNPNRSDRSITWQLLRDLSSSSTLPWCIIGDMNNVLSQRDKRGGRPYPNNLLEGFQQLVQDLGLIDIDLIGHPFTWERGRGTLHWVEARLDRALATDSWLNLFPGAKLLNTEVTTSDHCPLLLDPSPKYSNGSSRSFKRLIRSLKGLRDSDSIRKYNDANKQLFEVLTQKEIFWKQRRKQIWLKEGDNNSKFFHASARTRQRRNQICSLRNDRGVVVGWEDGLQDLIVNYFQTLFKSTVMNWDHVVNHITPSITGAHNELMMSPIDAAEVKRALFQMHPEKSPGPDGMTPGFYKKYWSIVGTDVVQAVKSFWDTEQFQDNLPFTNIALIPKKKSPLSMLDIRPISLCNVLYKIITKVLANRLKQVIDVVISDSQCAFIPGRLITDNIMISYELMHYMKRKSHGKQGYMAVKLDMSKAYDRVEWGYLRSVLCRMGFHEKLVSLFMVCVSSARYQIAHGGKEFGLIIPERGLRQGDPLSSYLFIICTEGFSALLQEYERKQFISGIQVARGAPRISHMFFADDSYIFCKANSEEANHVLSLLHTFELASGQKINYDKSSVFFSRNTLVADRDTICGEMGNHEADDQSTYLGLPNIMGRKKTVILGYLKERILSRIKVGRPNFYLEQGRRFF